MSTYQGPLGLLTNDPLVDDGTLVRTASNARGPIGLPHHYARFNANLLADDLRRNKGFSDYAVERMKGLADPDHSADMFGTNYVLLQKELNPQYTPPKPAQITDCITYIGRVLEYAFDKISKNETAGNVRGLMKFGTELATYLVEKEGWTGIYCNPDVNHPRDKDDEHIFSFTQAKKTKKYFGIPIKYFVINYHPTAKWDSNYDDWVGMSQVPTKKDTNGLEKLKKVKFGVGCSRGGSHTWMLSLGQVYEAHTDETFASVYENSDFATFRYLSGAIVVPPDTASERLQDLSWVDMTNRK